MASRYKPKNLPETRRTLETPQGTYAFYDMKILDDAGITCLRALPYSIRVLLENALRNLDGYLVTEDHVLSIAHWTPDLESQPEIPYLPARVVLQDFTGVPAVVDLAAMRSAMARYGGDPKRINPVIPADLIIDHSVQIDFFGTVYAFERNVDLEYRRNRERYQLLKWGQRAFQNFRVVPPGTGIIHQVNLEYLARVVMTRTEEDGTPVAFPDTLVGTDSHTTMINGLGVLGWGVGGIEAEAVLLGQPYYMLLPEVVGVRLVGELPEGATATDLVLTITELLRKVGVVGKFVEFFGPGVSKLSLPDRATLANMAPEYGATMGFFPVDQETLRFLALTGREDLVPLVEAYTKAQMLFRTDEAPEPRYTDVVELDLSTVEPSVAGPRRPQDRIPLGQLKDRFLEYLDREYHRSAPVHEEPVWAWESEGGATPSQEKPADTGARVVVEEDEEVLLQDGSVVIAAITSCTNTSNPSVMIAAGLVAKKAVERGLTVKPWVKTSLAPGSGVVTRYLEKLGLMEYLEALRFHLAGYGCTTCIGNSGPLPKPVAQAVKERDLVVASVLSGNRNFEGRVNPLVRANYLASPPLVVAFALAGRVDIDLTREPLAYDPNGEPVYLKDLWPTPQELQEAVAQALEPDLFKERYRNVFEGDHRWQSLDAPTGELYQWDPQSTYIQEPPFFKDLPLDPPPLQDIKGARVLALLGDSITTDHISPASPIPVDSPAGKYLLERGVKPAEFNTFGSRRGNHEVMMRGTFGNIRLRNRLVPDTEGGWTLYLPTGEKMTIYDAAMRYKEEGIPLIVLAGKEYGTGSSRDWAAKGTLLLGVKAVIAESFERIHRSNLVGVGVLPLQFLPGENVETLGLTGHEVYDILGIAEGLTPRKRLTVVARNEDGTEKTRFQVIARLESEVEIEYYRNGGILQTVLRKMIKGEM